MTIKTLQLSARFEVRVSGRRNRTRYTYSKADAFFSFYKGQGERVEIIEHLERYADYHAARAAGAETIH